MKPFFATIFGGMALVFLVVFHVDPKHLFHQELLPTRPPLRGEAMPRSIFFKYGPRPLKLAHLNYIEPPDLVLLGGSRTMLINSSMFKSIAFFNFTVDNIRVTDFIGLWEDLCEKNKRPAYLLLVLEGYAFNKNVPPGALFSTLRYSDRFLSRNSNPPLTTRQRIHLQQEHFFRQVMQFWSAINESMNWEMFRDSAMSILNRKPVWDMRGVMKEQDFSPGAPLYLGDGSISTFPMARDGLAEARLYGTLGEGMSPTMMYPWELNQEAVRYFDALLNDADRQGTRVMIIIPPFHPQSYRNISNLQLLSKPFQQYQSTFKKLAEAHPGTAFCDVMDPSLLGCEENDFADGLHIGTRCDERMIQYCFSGRVGWKDLIRPSVSPKTVQ